MKFLMTHWIRTLEAELRDIKATKKSFTKEQKKESERYIETRWVVLEESSLNEQYKYMARVIWGGLHKDKPELRMCDLADVIQHLKSDRKVKEYDFIEFAHKNKTRDAYADTNA